MPGGTKLAIERINNDTLHGNMCVAYSRRTGGVLAVILDPDAQDRVDVRFPSVINSEVYAGDLGRLMRELQDTNIDGEGETPEDIRPMMLRARI